MKKCPVCQTVYGREDLEFCLKDSAELLHIGPEEAHAHEMRNAAAYLPAPPQPYAVSPVVTAPATQVIRQGVSPAVLVALVALLLFVFAGGAVALLLRAYWSRPAETAQTTPPPAATATATPQPQVVVVNQTAPPAQPRAVAPVRYYGGNYPQGSSRALTDSELSGQGCWDLKIMRNEIYARRGYIFQTQDMISYFSRQSWYRPVSRNVALSSLERRNVARIQSYENAYGCR